MRLHSIAESIQFKQKLSTNLQSFRATCRLTNDPDIPK